jgi:signal peptidase I
MQPPRPRKLLSLALGLGILVCLWSYFAPVALGGSTTYVVTEGISMEPRFHTGDLALVRTQSSYHVGEIVAYHSKAFHTVVLHRIIGRAGSRYVFKGDNNNFVDFEHPAASQLIGALWLHIPGAGATLESFSSPALIGGLVALGTLLFAGGVFTRRRRRRRQARPGPGPSLAAAARPQRSLEPVAGALAMLMLALVPFAALGLLSFTRPSSRRVPVAVRYEQSGRLSYVAHSRPGPTYANDLAVTGDPLFTRVLSTAEMRFAYELHALGTHALGGKASLYAEVASTSGWRTTLELGHAIYFHGDSAVITAPLDLTSLQALVARVQDATGVGGSYTVTILPRVSVGGSVSALPFHAMFSPPIKFLLTPLELQPTVPATAASTTATASSAAPSPASQFAPSSTGSVTGERSDPLVLNFGVAHMTVATARVLALVGIGLVILALLAVLAYPRPPARDEAASIRSRYGRLIVPVARVSQLPGVSVIDVADMESLVRIAEHYDRSILQESRETGDAFWVTDESGQFRFALGSRAVEDGLATAEHAVASAPERRPAAGPAVGPAAEPATSEFSALGERPTDAVSAEAPSADQAAEAYTAVPAAAYAQAPNAAPAQEAYPATPTADPVTTEFGALGERQPGAMYGGVPGERLADEAYTATPYDILTSPDYADVPRDELAEEVYADELELGALGYEPSRAGRPKRSNTSPSLPAWTGSSG